MGNTYNGPEALAAKEEYAQARKDLKTAFFNVKLARVRYTKSHAADTGGVHERASLALEKAKSPNARW